MKTILDDATSWRCNECGCVGIGFTRLQRHAQDHIEKTGVAPQLEWMATSSVDFEVG